MKLYFPLICSVCLLCASTARAATSAELFAERVKSVVAVEFVVQTEVERRPVFVLGSVIDTQGTIIIPGAAINPGIAPDQLKDLKVYRPDSSEPFAAVYLGQDALTGWHFVRAEEKLRPQLVPLTHWPAAPAEPALGEELWGIGLRNKDEDCQPYFLSGKVGLVTRLPQKTAILLSEVAGPGLPAFDRAGRFVGLAQTSFGQNFLLFSRTQSATPVMLLNLEESSVLLLADEVLPHLGRVPQNPQGRPIPWLGVYGLQPVDPQVAKFLHLENQSGVVLSDILEGGPAARAGLQERDIVLAIDGRPMPHFKPDRIGMAYLGQEILGRRPGDKVRFTILRGTERRDLGVTLGDEPRMVREADRSYFERLGFTIREFLVNDGIAQRAKSAERTGVMVHFVKPNGPVATAGLRPDDWVREIDGEEMKTYDQAVQRLRTVETDATRPQLVLLVSRGGETTVLRAKLN